VRYLLDTNVVRELQKGAGAHANVRAWFATVNEADLRLSVMTILEARKGWERIAARDQERAVRGIAELEVLCEAYRGRILAIDESVAKEWGRLRGQKEKHQEDMAFAATARVHGLVLVTRNEADFRGRGVRILNPFKLPPSVVEV